MKPGSLVRFVRRKVKIPDSVGNTVKEFYLREDAIGIVISKVRHIKKTWIVNFPAMGGHDAYPESWLEVISEA